ncbi:MAG: protein translocase subunit SecF [Gammaproteobacteria bacterium]|nr:protein translocase subunit SecF [bacterium AH-315-E07]PCH61110.1 MAG: protein translocase subunit SecF [Gammaproteobacteria bacterium]
MDLFKNTPKFDFMAQRYVAIAVSTVVILIALASLLIRGLNLGIDFTGGTIIEVGYPDSADLVTVRSQLSENGYDDAIVQHFGTTREVLIRVAPRENVSNADLSNQVIDVLKGTGDPEVRRVEFVGPQVGEELTNDGGLALLYALGGILIYVYFRFEFRFALGSVAALIHDVIIVMGVISILGIEFNLTVLAAILAVIGYSLNDTIVVFDRIRENFRKMRKGSPIDVVNASLNQTLSRTLITSVTTLLVLFALFFLGGEVISGFALALIVGVFVGTYSSIYVASNITLLLGVSKEDLMLPQKEGSEVDDLP